MQSMRKQTLHRSRVTVDVTSCRHSSCISEQAGSMFASTSATPFKGVGWTRKGQAKMGGMASHGLESMKRDNQCAPRT